MAGKCKERIPDWQLTKLDKEACGRCKCGKEVKGGHMLIQLNHGKGRNALCFYVYYCMECGYPLFKKWLNKEKYLLQHVDIILEIDKVITKGGDNDGKDSDVKRTIADYTEGGTT